MCLSFDLIIVKVHVSTVVKYQWWIYDLPEQNRDKGAVKPGGITEGLQCSLSCTDIWGKKEIFEVLDGG